MASHTTPSTADDRVCHIGALPLELFDKILPELNSIRDLANFITTARFVYCRFQTRKEAVLFNVLQNELGPVYADARFLSVIASSIPSRFRDQEHRYDWLHSMAAVYRDMLLGRNEQCDGSSGTPGLAELTVLCRTMHQVYFLADLYAAAHSRAVQYGPPADAPTAATAPLSRTERLRLVRALYRRQILSHAWIQGARRSPVVWPIYTPADVAAFNSTGDHDDARPGLFAALEPWEIQQIDQANVFITLLCLHLAYSYEVSKMHVGRTIPCAQFEQLSSHMDCLVHYLRQNWYTAPTRSALVDLSRPANCTSTFFQYIKYSHDKTYELLPLLFAWQSPRFHPVLHNAVPAFTGDELDRAPFAWVDALNGHYFNGFFRTLCASRWDSYYGNGPRKTFSLGYTAWVWKRFGFAFWNKSRVEALKKVEECQELQKGWMLRRD